MTALPSSEQAPTLNSIKRRSTAQRLADNWNVRIGLATIFAFVLAALLAEVIWPVSPYEQDIINRLAPPVWDAGGGWANPLGTDALGRDILARLLHGARISLIVGLSAATIGMVIGVSLGVAAGYFGGRVDDFVNFVLTCQLALPGLLLAMALVFLIGPSLPVVIVVIGLLHWTLYLVVTRTATMRIRELDYVKASRVSGASTSQIMSFDVLPNLTGSIIVIFTLEVGLSILAEASLSFLGVGVPSPSASWGLMIAEGKAQMFLRPSLVLIPGAAIFVLVTAVNMLGDGLRDVLQPQGRS